MASDTDHRAHAPESEPEPLTPVFFVRPLSFAFARMGIPPEEFASGLGISLDDPDAMVSDSRIADTLEGIAARRQIVDLPLRLARNVPLGWFGNVDYCFSMNATLNDAFEAVRTQLDMIGENITHSHVTGEDFVRVFLTHLRPRPERVDAILSEVRLSFYVRRIRDVLGDDSGCPTYVRFRHRPRPSAEALQQFFACPIEYQASEEGFEFPTPLLSAPLLTADPELARLIAQRTQPPASAQRAEDPTLERTRGVIKESILQGRPAIELADVANRMDMSARSLQRRLSEQGVSFSSVIDDTRRSLAQAYLANEGMLLSDIAYRLGFSGVPAFFRAFRRWTGTSPRAFQKTNRAT